MKLIDCFTFFNELELLEMRLHELAPVVDQFVLVESTHTHQGKPKPLYFDENKHLFQRYNIRAVAARPLFKGDSLTESEAWANESHQRDVMRHLLSQGDLGLISDVDEIPSREAVDNLTSAPVKFKQRFSYYYLNLITDDVWYGTTAALTDDIIRLSPQAVCMLRYSPSVPTIESGWHFSYLGGPDRIKQKIEAFAHVEYNKDEYKDSTHLENVLAQGVDLFNRETKYRRMDLDDSFPHAVRERPEKYSALIC